MYTCNNGKLSHELHIMANCMYITCKCITVHVMLHIHIHVMLHIHVYIIYTCNVTYTYIMHFYYDDTSTKTCTK